MNIQKGSLEELSTASSPSPAVIRNQKAVDFWMQKKMMHKTALESISKLSGDRAKNEKDMKEAAVAIYAVEYLFRVQGMFTVTREELRLGDLSANAGDENAAANSSTAPKSSGTMKPKKSEEEIIKELTEKRKEELSMFKYFSKWVKDNKYTFSNVKISKKDLEGVTVGKETYKLLKVDLLVEDEKGEKNVIESLPFISLRKDDDKKTDKTTVVTNKLSSSDQFCNYIYMRELSKVWSDAKKELLSRIQEAMTGGSSKKAASRDSKEESPPR
jgi:hypothetical protein